MQRIHIKEPMGFQIIRRTVSMDVDDAVWLLCTRKQRKYTKAVRRNQATQVEVSRDLLICPYCCCEIPAYERYLMPIFKGKLRPSSLRMNSAAIREWGSRQVGFIEPKLACLDLNPVYRPEKGAIFLCPQCGECSLQSEESRHVLLTRERGRITLAREILNIGELMNSWLLAKKSITLTFPLYERVVFCLRNGHTYVTLGDAEGRRIQAVRDITDQPDSEWCHVAAEGVYRNKRVFATLKRMFIAERGAPLPFQGEALTFQSFVLMTRFPEYETEFFDELPYDWEGQGVEKSFKKAAYRLHTKKGAIRCLEASALPMIKSVRGLYFRHPALLFYRAEGERLFAILQDPNHFCNLMKGEMVYELLAQLHHTPGLFTFMEDYCRLRGASALLRKIKAQEWPYTKRYAAYYCLLRREDQRREQKQWAEKGMVLYVPKGPDFSRPFRIPDAVTEDCTVDGFRFCRLRSKRDYAQAGLTLENCLGQWEPWQNPVICVLQQGRAVAAIELCGSTIVQALGIANAAVSASVELQDAIKKWKHRYGLRESALLQRERAVNLL